MIKVRTHWQPLIGKRGIFRQKLRHEYLIQQHGTQRYFRLPCGLFCLKDKSYFKKSTQFYIHLANFICIFVQQAAHQSSSEELKFCLYWWLNCFPFKDRVSKIYFLCFWAFALNEKAKEHCGLIAINRSSYGKKHGAVLLVETCAWDRQRTQVTY